MCGRFRSQVESNKNGIIMKTIRCPPGLEGPFLNPSNWCHDIKEMQDSARTVSIEGNSGDRKRHNRRKNIHFKEAETLEDLISKLKAPIIIVAEYFAAPHLFQ